jgi:hypothetical protein
MPDQNAYAAIERSVVRIGLLERSVAGSSGEYRQDQRPGRHASLQENVIRLTERIEELPAMSISREVMIKYEYVGP